MLTWQMLLEAAVSDPDAEAMRLPLTDDAAINTMFQSTNPHPPTGDPTAICLHQLFEAAAHSHPDAACIRAESGTVSYAQVSRLMSISPCSAVMFRLSTAPKVALPAMYYIFHLSTLWTGSQLTSALPASTYESTR